MPNWYGVIRIIPIIGLLLIALIAIKAVASTPLSSIIKIVNETNNGIKTGLTKCGISKSSVTEEIPKVMNNTVIINIGLSNNNYTIQLMIKLTNNEIPIGGVNITVVTNAGKICYSKYIPISTAVNNYNYTILNAGYFIEIVSYTGVTPTVVNSSGSLTVYGTTMRSAIVIPIVNPTATSTVMGYVRCSTGALTPVYIINVQGRPIMYIMELNSRQLLCRYSQEGVTAIIYYIMAILIGVAVAIIYESALLILLKRRVLSLGVSQ